MAAEARPNVEVSVVIPTHEDASCLELTLRSLGRQSVPADRFEVIVVRDGGDGSQYVDVADAGKGLDLHFVELAERRGRAGARNEGVRHATAPLLLFLDADSYATPDLLARHLAHHCDPSAPAVLMGRRDELGFRHIHPVLAQQPTIPAPQRYTDGGDLRFNREEGPPGDNWLRAGWLFAFTHNISLSRVLFEAVGGFDETFGLRWGLEDMELFYRVHLHLGLLERNFAYDDEAAVYHLPHHRNLQRNWDDFWANKQAIQEKFPVVEWEFVGPLELFKSAERIVHYRAAIEDCLRRSACRIGPAVEHLTPHLPGDRVLWIGTHSDQTTLPEGALTFDYATPVGPTNFHLVGMQPPVAPASLDAVVSVDFWRYLRWEDFCHFISVVSDLASEVHLVCTGAELSSSFTLDAAGARYLSRILGTAFETTVVDVDGLGTVLRLRRQQPAVAAS